MRIYVRRDGHTLGPLSPEEVVAALRAAECVEGDAAWVEGTAVWHRVDDILRYAGLTPSGRPLSEKLQRPALFGDAPMPPDGFVDGARVVQPAVGPAPLLEKHGWDDPGNDGFDWTFVRKLGMAAPVLVLISMQLPWFSLIGGHSVNGFALFSVMSVPAVLLFFIFVFGVAYYSHQASMGSDIAASGATVCALLAIAPLALALWLVDWTSFETVLGMKLGGGADICISVLIITSGLASVPLSWSPETSVRMFFSLATVCFGLYFGIKGVVYLIRHAMTVKDAILGEILGAASSLATLG